MAGKSCGRACCQQGNPNLHHQQQHPPRPIAKVGRRMRQGIRRPNPKPEQLSDLEAHQSAVSQLAREARQRIECVFAHIVRLALDRAQQRRGTTMLQDACL